jgi:hypothetical protein
LLRRRESLLLTKIVCRSTTKVEDEAGYGRRRDRERQRDREEGSNRPGPAWCNS